LGKKERMNIASHISSIEKLVPGEMSAKDQGMVLSTLESVLQFVSEQSLLIQSLRDEINRLKGEDGKPTISGKNQKEKTPESSNISSESNRKPSNKPRQAKSVKFDSNRAVDETERIDIADKSQLPLDIVFKGYAKSHYQSLEIRAKLIEVQRAIYYSASTKKTYTADLPVHYELGSDYTQELKAHICLLKFSLGLSIPKIGEFLRMQGVYITNGTISNIILENGDSLKEERMAIHEAGLATGLYESTDTTASRFNGVNYNTHVFGNAGYTAYFTKPHKDRQTVLDLIRAEQARIYLLNEHTFILYDYLQIPFKITRPLKNLVFDQVMDENTFMVKIMAHLKSVLDADDYQKHEPKLLEGAYIAAYFAQNPLNILVCDNAPQYKLISLLIALCWVHAGRHFKKLNPKVKYHQDLQNEFLNLFWAFYQKLKDYKLKPDKKTAAQLADEFDLLFSRKSGYQDLDDRIDKTRAIKQELLIVLKHPYLPLHNNDTELAVRREVRYRDISFQTRTQKGTQAKDVFFTIIQTCKKLGVNAYLYIMDRVTKKFNMTPLELLVQKHNCALP
jgi:hypothetical protein